MQLTKAHIGQKFVMVVSHGGILTEIEGVIGMQNSTFILHHSYAPYHTITPDSNNKSGLPYALSIGSQGRVDNNNISNLMKFRLLKEDLIYKKDPSGILFRKVYRKEENVVFLGSIQKDPEDCKRPSRNIVVMDMDYLTSEGWALYTPEASAEDRVAEDARKKR